MKELKLNLVSLILVIFIVVVIIALVVIEVIKYQTIKMEDEMGKLDVSEGQETEVVKTLAEKKADAYAKYQTENIEWLVKERFGNSSIEKEHLIYGTDINNYYPFIIVENGKMYYSSAEDELNEDKTINLTVDTIKGNVVYIYLANEKETGAYENVYAITDDGTLWFSNVNHNGKYNSFEEVKRFDSQIIDVANVNGKTYYLLLNGDLLDENGNSYEK